MMYQCSKKLVKYKEYSCFDHSDFPAHSMFTFDVCWGNLGTSIFGNSSSAASNTGSRLPSRLYFHFLWLWSQTCYRRGRKIAEKFLSTLLLICWYLYLTSCYFIYKAGRDTVAEKEFDIVILMTLERALVQGFKKKEMSEKK